MIKVKTDDKEFEVNEDQLTLPEGYALVTPDRVPKGLFTQEALNSKVDEITKVKVDKAKQELKSDKEFHTELLSEYNISLDKEGKPKGLKPEFDPDEWKQNQAKQLVKPYEDELEQKNQQLNSFKRGLIRSEILKSANGKFKDEFVQSFTGDDDPFVVKQFEEMFDVDENGTVALKDSDGTFAIRGDSKRVTVDSFFNENKEKFANLIKDNRQTGSNFNKGGNPANTGNKKRSEIKAEEKGAMFSQWRKEGKSPREQWEKIPY